MTRTDRTHVGWLAALAAATLLAGVPAAAQGEAREDIARALASDDPAAAFERWLAASASAPGTTSGGLVGAFSPGRPAGSAPVGLGPWRDDAIELVDAAVREALGRYGDAPTDGNLRRLEELSLLRERLLGERDAAGRRGFGVPLVDALGRPIGWDRDGDGVADLIDRDGDGLPDHYLGSSLWRPRAVAPLLGPAKRGKQFGALTFPGERERERGGKRSEASSGAGRDLPAAARMRALSEEAGAAADQLADVLGRTADEESAAGLAIAAVERLLEKLDALRTAAQDLADQARRGRPTPAAARGAGEAIAGLVDLEERINAAGHALQDGDPVHARVARTLDEVPPTWYETVVAAREAGIALRLLPPDTPMPDRPEGAAEQGAGVGTGFFVGDGRHVVTNSHVVGDNARVEVQVGERSVSGQVVARDPALDLALVRLGASFGQPLRFGREARRPGVVAFAFGYGVMSAQDSASQLLVTRGSVCAVEEGVIVFDGHVNPGNSGGPLVDARGAFLGVVVAKTISDERRGVDAVGLVIDGERAAAWLAENGVQVQTQGGLPRADAQLDDATIRPSVVRIVRRPE